ncbi:WhiB family transcriptional regulator [Luteococcus sp. H138]|uniref:WhiB family transcriptional regulator n=1 Tax=unclassified Luteococcus TaxID=2639923 RepID=UPI00313D3D03
MSVDVVISAPSSPAACSDADPNLFFADDMATVEQAKQVCSSCPVREQCLDGALERAEPHGVWGGELFDGGRVIARKRPRGRPRKHPVAAEAPRDDEAQAA